MSDEGPRTVRDVFIEYLEWDREQCIRENRSNKRFAIVMVAVLTVAGLVCVGALGGQGLGWW